jgi:hypothetical protein
MLFKREEVSVLRRGDRTAWIVTGFALLGAFGALAASAGGRRFVCPNCKMSL